MRLSGLKLVEEQSPKEISDYREAQLFSDDLSSIGEEQIIKSKLLFHGAFAAKETEEAARRWDLRLQVIHLGDVWEGESYPSEEAAVVGFIKADQKDEPIWMTPNDYVERTGKSGGASINNNILAIKTEHSVVILYRFWAFNESSQYPEELRNIDNELHILRTGGYSVYRFPADQWGRITEVKNFEEWEEDVLTSDDQYVISHWRGFGNI